MTENLVSGKKYRILTNAANDAWDRISFWTKASDVYYNDNTTAEANKPLNILKRSTAYTANTIAYESTAPSWSMLKCSTAGTTAASTPTYSSATAGATITDGGAKFQVYDIRPQTTLSSSSYTVPAMSLLNSINNKLIANSHSFQFAYDSTSQKYGYKLDGTGTFVPFGGSGKSMTEVATIKDTKAVNISLSSYSGWQNFTNDDFILVPDNSYKKANHAYNKRTDNTYSDGAQYATINAASCGYAALAWNYVAATGVLSAYSYLIVTCSIQGNDKNSKLAIPATIYLLK